MELLERLAEAAQRQHEEADLPEWLVAAILEITGAPECYLRKEELIEMLLHQVEAFDSYAGAGCFGDSVSAAGIEATLKALRGGD